MGKGKSIDSFFGKKRDECEQPNVHVQTPLLVLEFEQQSHEERVHQTQTNDAIFRGIETLQRDPALRPQISQYPVNRVTGIFETRTYAATSEELQSIWYRKSETPLSIQLVQSFPSMVGVLGK
jgi:hypothetical protein